MAEVQYRGEYEEKVNAEKAVWGTRGKKYGVYLFAIALLGWALASYNYNLLTVAYPVVEKALHLTAAEVGETGTVISLVSIFVPIAVGYWMDARGRRIMWMTVLAISAVFTALTAIASNFAELVFFRSVASAFGLSELGVSVTIVNESLGPKSRGWLYSWVQGGWPLGVFIASGIYLATISFGFRVVFAIGAIPLIAVFIGRYWIKDPERYENLKKIRELLKKGVPKSQIAGIEEFEADLDESQKVTFRQIFATPGYVRRQLIKVMVTWFFYASSWMLPNVFISAFLVNFYGWSSSYVALLLLISGGLGFFFYPLGGYLGEKFGRKYVLIGSAAFTPLLAGLFILNVHNVLVASILYFFIYQVTNGTWSGVGYTYWAESFPTRVRGTVMGFLTGWFNFSNFAGSLIYTALVIVFVHSPILIWVILGVILSAGELSSIALRNIKPGSTLEEIAV
ncbi:MFS transporter [Thermogymnomonas acidicola]|uniref:MFS transporter n=1 Tax=Thermogymnomonas acidicola TaxID=399579 RepID=A0AA37F9B3_9ARCH|nr:MFS transporter [Thermogymnomonas acidicola]GGM72702.1 MFS transporter [Thermogymnomonas acidicola]